MTRTPTREWHIGETSWIWNGDRPEEATLKDAASEGSFWTDCLDAAFPQMFVCCHVSALFETADECWQYHIQEAEREAEERTEEMAARKRMYAAWKERE